MAKKVKVPAGEKVTIQDGKLPVPDQPAQFILHS